MLICAARFPSSEGLPQPALAGEGGGPDEPAFDDRERTMTMKKLILILPLTLFFCGVTLSAQETGGLEIGEVVIGPGERPVVLPPSRKGEVIDTAFYMIPDGEDTLLFGARISNLEGDGGALPVDGEFETPFVLTAEASIGSYVSPRGRVALEYAEDRWNGRAMLDLRSTAGHVDGAEGTSLMIQADGEYQIPGDLPSPGKARVGLGIDYMGDDYSLFGNSIDASDRSRSRFGFDLRLASETDQRFDYDINLAVESFGVTDDSITGGAREVSATSPGFGARFRIGHDSLSFGVAAGYNSISLDYDRPTESLDHLYLKGSGDWSPASGLFVTVGFIAARSDFSDSGSSTLVMPRGAIRYELSRTIGLFGRFVPELRAPSYRTRIMAAPFVDAEIDLRPERVPIDLAAGVRVGFGRTDLEVEAGYAEADNTPVVTLGAAEGTLLWVHRPSQTITLAGRLRSEVSDRADLHAELGVNTDTDRDTDQQLPMRPVIEARVGTEVRATEKLGLTGSLLFQSERNVTYDTRLLPAGVEATLDSRFLVDLGGTWELAEQFQLFAEVTNLLALDYSKWQGYQGEGLEVRIGGRGRF